MEAGAPLVTTTGYGWRRERRKRRERKERRERRRRRRAEEEERAEEQRNGQTSSSERMVVKHISRFPFLCFKIKRPPLAVYPEVYLHENLEGIRAETPPLYYYPPRMFVSPFMILLRTTAGGRRVT